MQNTTRRYVRQNPRNHRTESGLILAQMGAALIGGLASFSLILLALSFGYRLLYAGRIFPGVSIAGVNLAGMTPTNAAVELSTRLTYPYSGRIVFRDGNTLWASTPAQLGMVFDPQASANAAFRYGRSPNPLTSLKNQLNSLQTGVELAPQNLFDQRIAHAYLQSLATQINQPLQEASLSIDGTQVVAAPGQIGRTLNVDATLTLLNNQLASFRDGEITLIVTEQTPEVLNIEQQVEQAQRLLAAPFIISLPDVVSGDPGPWQIEPQTLAPLLGVNKVSTDSGIQFQLELDPNKLRPILQEIARQVNRPEENARFIFNDETRQIEPIQASKIGREVDQTQSIAAIQQAIAIGQPSANLQINLTQPQVADTASGAELGILENTASYTSYFRGSSAARMQNIQTAAAQFHGLLVAPGQTFSMGAALGDVSLDSGYAEALIIYGGRTIQGVGGGVCQVSTTLFRTAFFAGFPIPERYAHAYRVSYYEQSVSGLDPNLAGLDATVYFPLVDFKFTNDSAAWLLMETYFSAQSQTLTWKFYSTSDGRTVQWDTSGPQNIVPAPSPILQLNNELGPNEFKQVDWHAQGADVTVNRTVLIGDRIHFVDKFNTHYQPWADICEYGSGVEDPKKIAKKKGICWEQP
jgi:vancomycin resistance protein YoaR